MRATLILLAALVCAVPASARADNGPDARQIDWQYDFGLTLPEKAKFPHRFLFRWNTESHHDGADTFTVQYGRGWRWNARFLMKLSLGYAGTTFDAGSGRHEVVLTVAKEMTWDRNRARFKMEGQNFLGGDGYRYRGHYAFDWWFAGVHLAQEDGDTLVGFQLSSGPNAEIPLRVEVRHSFGVIGDAPDHMVRIAVIMDTD